MKTVAFCEIEPFCQKVLAKHWPGVPIYDDIKTLTAERLRADGIGRIDVITGGFPCQDISAAGRQAGITAERSGLWSELARIISEVRPDFAIVENVTTLLSGERGRWFGRVLGDLAEIGYDAEWYCIPATHVGAPHNRDRIWVIADPIRGEGYKQPYSRKIGRVGREFKSLAWDGGWEAALTRFRRLDDGVPRSVASTDGYRNAVVPQIPEIIGRAIMASHEN